LTVIVGVGVELTDSLVAVIVAVPTLTAVTVAGEPLELTVSTAVLLEIHVTVRAVSRPPLASLVVAVNCCVPPTIMGVTGAETVTAATGAGVTVIVAFPLFPSLVALILAVPSATAVTTPWASTVATAVLFEAQVIVRPVSVLPLASSVVAVACEVPTAVIDVGERATVTVATGAGFTMIVGVGLELTDSLVAVIVAVPTPTAVTVAGEPLGLTVSAAVLLETQVTTRPVSTVPFASLVVAVSCCA
jgi:hypothetical protein